MNNNNDVDEQRANQIVNVNAAQVTFYIQKFLKSFFKISPAYF